MTINVDERLVLRHWVAQQVETHIGRHQKLVHISHVVLSHAQVLLPLSDLPSPLIDQRDQISLLLHAVLVYRLEELDCLLHCEEHVAFLGHVKSVIIGELFDEEHLRFEVLDPRLDHDIHQNGQILISCQLDLVLFHSDSLPELEDIFVNLLAYFRDEQNLLSRRDRR